MRGGSVLFRGSAARMDVVFCFFGRRGDYVFGRNGNESAFFLQKRRAELDDRAVFFLCAVYMPVFIHVLCFGLESECGVDRRGGVVHNVFGGYLFDFDGNGHE